MDTDKLAIRDALKEVLMENPDYFDDIFALNSPIDLALVHNPDFKIPAHIRLINDHLIKIDEDKINRLAIFAPPGHSKSMTTAYFIAWSLLKNPHERIIYATYGQDLSDQQSMLVKKIVTEVGPLFGVYIDNRNNSRNFWKIEGTEGYFRATGIGGPISGMRASLAVLDDPVKNMEEALSPSVQQKTHDWYGSTFLSRLTPKGKVVLIQTIWSVNDIGYEIQQDKESHWTVLNLPAYAMENDILGRKPGELLWKEVWNEEAMELKRKELGEWQFTALYQQNPTARGGNLLNEDWLQYYDPREIRFSEGLFHKYMGVDLAISTKNTADYTCTCTIFQHMNTGDIYIRDWTQDKISPLQQQDLVVKKFNHYSHDLVGIETVAYQAALPEMILKNNAIPIRQLKPTTDKVLRIQMRYTLFENGKVYLPDDHPLLAAFESEYVQFPKGKHDDLLDATEMALSLINSNYSSAIGDTSYHYGKENLNNKRGMAHGDKRSKPRFKDKRRRR